MVSWSENASAGHTCMHPRTWQRDKQIKNIISPAANRISAGGTQVTPASRKITKTSCLIKIRWSEWSIYSGNYSKSRTKNEEWPATLDLIIYSPDNWVLKLSEDCQKHISLKDTCRNRYINHTFSSKLSLLVIVLTWHRWRGRVNLITKLRQLPVTVSNLTTTRDGCSLVKG